MRAPLGGQPYNLRACRCHKSLTGSRLMFTTLLPVLHAALSLMTAWRGLLTANVAPVTELLKFADSKFNQFYAPKLHTAASKAELSSEGVCVSTWASRSPPVHGRLSIAVLQVNAGIAVEGATDAARDAVAGAFNHRGSH